MSYTTDASVFLPLLEDTYKENPFLCKEILKYLASSKTEDTKYDETLSLEENLKVYQRSFFLSSESDRLMMPRKIEALLTACMGGLPTLCDFLLIISVTFHEGNHDFGH
eukprot:TRINITY_DN3723_c0_g1_i18.p1 TRINITY_DN3723_c0_g1~~TRINITY_DN3723_c0_g1_i18.p1  ORF type:complete len:109 (-),score=10.43 TRINITY_DN3723_c0_g1_i18:407-733(-)